MSKQKDFQVVRMGRKAHQQLKAFHKQIGVYANRFLDDAVLEKIQREKAKLAKKE